MLEPEQTKHTVLQRVIVGQPDVKMSSFEHGVQQAMALIASTARKHFRKGYFKSGLRTFHFVLEAVEPEANADSAE